MSNYTETIDFIKNQFPSKSFIPLHEPIFGGNEKEYLLDTINSTFVSSVGEYVDFEVVGTLESFNSDGLRSIIFTMPILFYHNSVTVVSQYFDYDPAKDTYYLTSTQDISGMLDDIKKSRDNPEVWNKGVKQEWAHFASIPPVVEMQLKQKGIDMYNPDHTKALVKEINENYPYLKLTTKRG